ncbi:MAG: hypothetical protein PHQ43_14745 [Dehalococcoidales bacterium]|nr:hypothetical protein [Dehalococcoidales bacterium]
MEYSIKWEIDLSAESPQEAAAEALGIQRDKNSTATIFSVTDSNGKETYIDASDGKQVFVNQARG